MGDLRLFLLGQLCKGLCLVRHEEYGVIAETALPHGGKSDGAGSLPLGGDGIPIGEGTGNGAGKMSRPGGLPPHSLQQQHIPSPVIQPLAAVPGGVHTGAAVEGVHAQAGIVSDGGQLRQLADGLGLQHGILREGAPGLLHVHGDPQVLGTYYLHTELAQNGPHFPDLIGIMGR